MINKFRTLPGCSWNDQSLPETHIFPVFFTASSTAKNYFQYICPKVPIFLVFVISLFCRNKHGKLKGKHTWQVIHAVRECRLSIDNVSLLFHKCDNSFWQRNSREQSWKIEQVKFKTIYFRWTGKTNPAKSKFIFSVAPGKAKSVFWL